MPWYLNPDDWFGRYPGACFAMIMGLVCLASTI